MGTRWISSLFGFACILSLGTPLQAQDYPSRAITIVVPSAPGGGQDTLARVVAAKLGDLLQETVLVDNRPGAGGSVGAEFVANADADGYTLLLTTINNAINMSVAKDLNYSLTADLTGVTELVQAPLILCVNPDVPAKTLQEFINLAKAKPGELNFGSSGIGGSSHLGMELLKLRAGIDMLHIPLEGAGPSITELLAGRIDASLQQSAAVQSLVEEGKLRTLAVTSAKRSALTPDIPSMAELGVQDYDFAVWYGLTAPSKTPKEVIQKLHEALMQALSDAEFKEKLISLGFDIVGADPDSFNALIAADVKRWEEVVKASGAAEQ